MQSSNSSIVSKATATTTNSSTMSSTRKMPRKFYPKKIFLHVAPSTTETGLFSETNVYGPVQSVRIPTDPQGKSRGFAFVTFRWSEDAAKAIQGLDGTKLDGLVLRDIRWATGGGNRKQGGKKGTKNRRGK